MSIEKISKESLNITEDKIIQLKQLFPEIFTENKIDFDKFKLTLGQEVNSNEEKYSFNWAGRKNSFKNIQSTAKGTLNPAKEESINFDETENIFIEGDNLEVLKLLQKTYFNKIKMIYIDPPYNTGKDFVYKDNFHNSIKAYLEQTGQTNEEGIKLTTNTETNGRYHSDWISMMYPRLFLARNLLKEDGVIFISIDDNEVHNLRKICDEIFGEENFILEFPRLTKKGGKSSNTFAKNNDYVLVYCKDSNFLSIGGIEFINSKYNLQDEYFEERGYYNLSQTLDYNSLQYSKSMDYLINIENEEYVPGGSIDLHKKRHSGIHKRIDWVWRWSYDKFKFGLDNGFIVVKKNEKRDRPRIYTKTYLNASVEKGKDGYYIQYKEKEKTISSIELVDNKYSNDNSSKEIRNILGDNFFEYTKPTSLIKLFLSISSESNDIILDFFAGSATTAHAVLDLNNEDGGNRKFICVQLPEKIDEKSEAYKAGYKNIAEISKERIRRVIKKIIEEQKESSKQKTLTNKKEEVQDLGFKVFKLDTSNYKIWEKYEGRDEKELKKQLELFKNPLIQNYKDENVIYESMIKAGYNLNSKIEKLEIKTNKVYIVKDLDSFFYISLDKNIDEKTIENLKLKKENIFVCLDDALDDSKKKNLSLQCNLKVI